MAKGGSPNKNTSKQSIKKPGGGVPPNTKTPKAWPPMKGGKPC